MYVITLFSDRMRSVISFNFEKAASSVLTTCMTVCEEGYLFLGSRLGNSLLLRYTEKLENGNEEFKAENISQDEQHAEEKPKKLRLDSMDDWMASDVALIQDSEDLEVYGSITQTEKQLTSYTFEVCDSLLNIGPCGKICMGEPAFLSEEFSGSLDPDLELVTTSGDGKNGALSVLQRSVKPQVVTTFELPGCVDMWTVIGQSPDPSSQPQKSSEEKNEKTDTEEIDDESSQQQKASQSLKNSHAFLILSRADSSMILQTGQEINELDHSGFSTQAPTVYIGSVGVNRFIVKVSPMGVRLLSGFRQLQHIPLDVGSPIVWASVADPYIMIMRSEGLVIQLILWADTSGLGARLAVSRPQLAQVVFVCGTYPHWLFLTSHGELRVHPMGIDGAITYFAAFHNVNCPNGFLYFNKQAAETGSGKTGAFCLPILQIVWETLKDQQLGKGSKGGTIQSKPSNKWAMSFFDRGSALAVSPDGKMCQSREPKEWHGCRSTKSAQERDIISDIKVPADEFDGRVTYGQKRKDTGSGYQTSGA